MDKVIVMVGPTASGKTNLSIELAKRIGGEIISADSMQIYKMMDIGTAKPDREEMQGIRHYLIDEVYPDEEFSVAKFQSLALKYIGEILDKGKVPIVVGGTGLYINSLVYNYKFSETISDWNYRERLKQTADEKGREYLHEELRKIDPEAAKRIHVNDLKRIIRALEVFHYTQKTMTHHQDVSRTEPSPYQFTLFGLTMDRELLYERINRRVDIMMEKGLVEEVRKLVKLGFTKKAPAMQGLGYKEIISYLRGEATFGEAVDLLKKNTRHYAKRQLTWFRRMEEVNWIDAAPPGGLEDLLKSVNSVLQHLEFSYKI